MIAALRSSYRDDKAWGTKRHFNSQKYKICLEKRKHSATSKPHLLLSHILS